MGSLSSENVTSRTILANAAAKLPIRPRREDLLGSINVTEREGATAIPYYAWSNRGAGDVAVWLPVG